MLHVYDGRVINCDLEYVILVLQIFYQLLTRLMFNALLLVCVNFVYF